MNDGVDGADQPDNEPPAPDTPVPASPPEWTSPESPAPPADALPEEPAAPQPPSAFPSGYPQWAAATPASPPPASSLPVPPPPGAPQPAADSWGGGGNLPVPPPPSASQPAGDSWAGGGTPVPPPPSAPQPAAAPWAGGGTPPGAPPPAASWGGADPWAPAWPPAPPPLPPHPHASRRTAALAALLLFAAAAGASAGVVALTTHGSPAASTAQTSPATPFQPGNGSDGSSSSGGGSSTGNGSPLTQSQIEAKLDPAIVDITVTLAGGQGTAEGTGMVITSNGQVLTNNHVIDGASTIKVQIGGTGNTYNASVVGYDVTDDIALLQLQGNPSGLTTIQTGDPSQLNVGDAVLALGNALGRGGAPQPAAGTVTALDQTITAGDASGQSETLSGLIETNANIQPGDSGGPLVNSSGQVIGMDTAASVSGGRFHRIGGTTGQGYAIPIDTAMQLVQQIRSGGGGNSNIQTGQRALIGVEITGSAAGATVAGVQPGSPAESAGIVAGDVITSVGGTTVTSASSLQAAILTHKPGDRVSVSWTDPGGQQHTATVTLISGPPA